MNQYNHITLTAKQANTFNTTGRLEGFKELCDVCNKPLTPTRAVGQVYACKEPCCIDDICPDLGEVPEGGGQAFVIYFDKYPPQWKEDRKWCNCPKEFIVQWFADIAREAHIGYRVFAADEMPVWAVRLHAKIATEPTLSIHEGKLVWTYDLVKE